MSSRAHSRPLWRLNDLPITALCAAQHDFQDNSSLQSRLFDVASLPIGSSFLTNRSVPSDFHPFTKHVCLDLHFFTFPSATLSFAGVVLLRSLRAGIIKCHDAFDRRSLLYCSRCIDLTVLLCGFFGAVDCRREELSQHALQATTITMTVCYVQKLGVLLPILLRYLSYCHHTCAYLLSGPHCCQRAHQVHLDFRHPSSHSSSAKSVSSAPERF